MNIVMKHLSMMHFLLFFFCSIRLLRSHSEPLSLVFFPGRCCFLLNSPHGMRMCCSLSIDSFCDFYSYFSTREEEKNTNHLPMCRVLFCVVVSLWWALSWTVFCPFFTQHTTLSLLVGALRNAYTIYIKRCYCCVFCCTLRIL